MQDLQDEEGGEDSGQRRYRGTPQPQEQASDHHTPTCVYKHIPGVAVGQSLGAEQGSAAGRGGSHSSPSLS